MPGFYSKFVGPKLRAQLDEMLQESHDKQLSLYEEIAVSRTAAMQALALAEPALTGEIKDPRLVSLSISVVQQAMSHVANLVQVAARIEKDADDKFSLKVLALFVMQITKAVYEVLGEDNETAARIVAAIDDRVKVPRSNERRAYDSNVEFALLSAGDEVASKMDAATLPSDPAEADEEHCEDQDSGGGSSQREDGASEASSGAGPEREEAVA